MQRKLNKLYAILLIILSLALVGCEDKPDAYLCVFIQETQPDGLPSQYSFCVNSKTGQEMNVDVKDMKNWITTSPDEFEKLRDWYKSKCKVKI